MKIKCKPRPKFVLNSDIKISNESFRRFIRVCGISHADELSRGFNGLSSTEMFLMKGINYSLLSDIHYRKDGHSITPLIFKSLKVKLAKLEKRSGFQSRLYFWTWLVRFRREFRTAHVVHYHILHNEFFRLEALKYLTKVKKSVWTLHDLWLGTGHCIQPLDCSRFGKGCGNCPDLSRTLPVKRDRTSKELLRKKNLISKIDCDYIVSTEWMRNKTLQTLPIEPSRLHVIPFGVDTDFFKPLTLEKQTKLRSYFNMSPNYYYVFVNAHDNYIKGIDIVRDLVVTSHLEPKIRFILIDPNKNFLLSNITHSFPRATKPADIRLLIQLSDIVLIPSRGESFSLVALESMSCGRPVITLRNSAPHEVTASDLEFTFTSKQEQQQIYDILLRMCASDSLGNIEGERNRNRALELFNLDLHTQNMVTLYRAILEGSK